MKKLLYITAFPPNHRSGGQEFSLNAIKDLSGKYRIGLIYFNFKDHVLEPNIPVTVLKQYDISKFDWLRSITIYPLFTRRFNRKVLSYIQSIVDQFDVIYFDYCQIALYSLYVEHPYKIVRAVDVIYQRASRENVFLKYWVGSIEKKIFESAGKVFVPSEKDAEIVKKVYGVDVYYTHEYLRDFRFYETTPSPRTFVFFGQWSRKENLEGLLWFIKNTMPLIKQELNIKYLIIGGGLCERIKCQYIDRRHNIEYAGFVEDALDIIYRSSALIAPLFHGAGVKVKVIDAFTTGTPVVGTDIAFEGLPHIDGLCYKAHSPEEYAKILSHFPGLSYLEKKNCSEKFRSRYDNHRLSDYL